MANFSVLQLSISVNRQKGRNMDWIPTARSTHLPPRVCLIVLLLSLSGCAGSQSILDPAGIQAERIASLFWWMFGGGMLIWIGVVALAGYVIKVRPGKHQPVKSQWLIIGGGVVFPALVLTALLIFGLSIMPDTRPGEGERADIRISVAGEQWWWRVHYQTDNGESVELANEIRLPVGRTALFELTSTNVIHSFWIPALGGKVDMIPGRTNQLLLEPTRPGTFQGACAEYCGTSHSFMRFRVRVMEQQAFDQWLAAQAQPAHTPTTPEAREGRRVFMSNGCASCHTIRGTAADGQRGPDLTHVGSRLSLAAGTLPMAPESFTHWIGHTRDIKPGVVMPRFEVLGQEKLEALAAYLTSLE